MIYSKGLLSLVGEGISLEMDIIILYYDPVAKLLYLDTIKVQNVLVLEIGFWGYPLMFKNFVRSNFLENDKQVNLTKKYLEVWVTAKAIC